MVIAIAAMELTFHLHAQTCLVFYLNPFGAMSHRAPPPADLYIFSSEMASSLLFKRRFSLTLYLKYKIVTKQDIHLSLSLSAHY